MEYNERMFCISVPNIVVSHPGGILPHTKERRTDGSTLIGSSQYVSRCVWERGLEVVFIFYCSARLKFRNTKSRDDGSDESWLNSSLDAVVNSGVTPPVPATLGVIRVE